MKKRFLIFLLSLIIALPVSAEVAADGNVTFEQAYQLMIENNNSLKAAFQGIEEKKYKKRAARGEFLPKVAINSTYAHLDSNIGMSLMNGMVEVPIQDRNVWGIGGGAVWNIFTGGKILALNSAANAAYQGANEQYRDTKNKLTVELIKRYYGLRLAEDVVTVRTQVYDAVKKHVNDAYKLEKEGIIPKSERLHAEVALSEADRNLKASIRDKNIIHDSLKKLISNGDNTDINALIPVNNLFLYKNELDDLSVFQQEAIVNNTSLSLLEIKKKLAQAKYRGELGNYSPTISLFAYDIVGTKNLTDLAPRWALGASLNFTLFDGLERYNNVKAASAVKKQVEFESEDAKTNIELLVNKYYEEIQKYKEQYESTNKAIESATESVRVTTLSFNEGYTTSLAVTDAQTALAAIKVIRLSSLYNYDVTLAELIALKGNAEEITNYINNSITEKL